MPEPAVHPDLDHVSVLLGTWSGTGKGEYPTIEPFEYAESITFGHVGKPFLAYSQRTRSLNSPALPMHAETGFWRFPANGLVEAILSHPTGINEIEEGTLQVQPDGTILIELVTSSVSLSTSAKSVTGVERSFRISGNQISYTLRMAAVGQPMQHHLSANLVRETSD